MTPAPTVSSSYCALEPCIFWNIPALFFAVGILLIILGVFAKWVIILLLALINLFFRKVWKKPSWCQPLTENLLVPTTWFLRFGCFMGAYIVLLNESTNATEPTQIIFYFFAVPFCIAWLWWTYVFLTTVSRIIVDEYDLREIVKMNEREKQLASMNSSLLIKSHTLTSNALLHQQKEEPSSKKKRRLQSSRSTSLSQVLMIFQIMIMIVVIAIACSILQISFTDILNETNVWWLPVVLALVPHIRSIYYGTLFMFLYTDDDWNCVQTGNTCILDGQSHVTDEASLARVKMVRECDQAMIFAPLNYFMDHGAESESLIKPISKPCGLRLSLRPNLSGRDLEHVKQTAEAFLISIHPDLSMYDSYLGSAMMEPPSEAWLGRGFVSFDVQSNELVVFVHVQTAIVSFEILRESIRLGLCDVLRSYLQSTPDGYIIGHPNVEREFTYRIVDYLPESGLSTPNGRARYSLLEPETMHLSTRGSSKSSGRE